MAYIVMAYYRHGPYSCGLLLSWRLCRRSFGLRVSCLVMTYYSYDLYARGRRGHPQRRLRFPLGVRLPIRPSALLPQCHDIATRAGGAGGGALRWRQQRLRRRAPQVPHPPSACMVMAHMFMAYVVTTCIVMAVMSIAYMSS